MIYLYFSNKIYRKAEYNFYELIIKNIKRPVIIEENNDDIFCCIGKFENEIPEKEIRNVINSAVSLLCDKLSKELKKVDVVILFHHSILSEREGFQYFKSTLTEEGNIKQDEDIKEIKENSKREEIKEKVEEICNKYKERNVKICVSGESEGLVTVVSDEFGATTNKWKAQIKDGWQFEACTEDDESMKEMIERIKGLKKENYILVHEEVKEKVEEKIHTEKINVIIKDFRHMDTDLLYLAIKSQNAQKIKKTVNYHLFTILKHRVAHLLLPLNIDLQGINVVWQQVIGGQKRNKKRKAEEYLEVILEEKKETYYRQILAKLHFMISRVNKGEASPKLKCNNDFYTGDFVKPGINKRALPGELTLLDLISKDRKNTLKAEWENLLTLCGLGLKNRKVDLFDHKYLESKYDSPIFQFMCLLDCKIKKKGRINMIDVEEIIGAERGKIVGFFCSSACKYENDKTGQDQGGWKTNAANSKIIKSFHNWVSALNDCLERLGEKLFTGPKPGKKITTKFISEDFTTEAKEFLRKVTLQNT